MLLSYWHVVGKFFKEVVSLGHFVSDALPSKRLITLGKWKS